MRLCYAPVLMEALAECISSNLSQKISRLDSRFWVSSRVSTTKAELLVLPRIAPNFFGAALEVSSASKK